MRSLLVLLTLFAASPVFATTYQFDIVFKGDKVLELQSGFDSLCFEGEPCYPDGFRLPTGYFADLEPGQQTTAMVDLHEGTAEIAGWSVPGLLSGNGSALAHFFELFPSTATIFTEETISVIGDGPGANIVGFCDAGTQDRNLPDGYCGFFGYEASFDVLSVSEIGALSEVPLPASAAFLIGGLVMLGLRRRKTT